jgi:S1-C subfamily serine protease
MKVWLLGVTRYSIALSRWAIIIFALGNIKLNKYDKKRMRVMRTFQATVTIGLLFSFAVPLTTYSQSSRKRQPSFPVGRRTSDRPPKIDFSDAASNKPLTPRQIVEKVLPSVVLIVAQDENGEAIGQGSGFFYKSGLVATNLHVFTRASQAYVKVLGNGVTYKVAEVRGIDMRRDLCVVRIDDTSISPLTLNGSSKPAVGDEVYVASNPKGLEGSFSKGIVSSIRKDAGLVQIDAAISPGSSGGAVVNTRGEVIGIAVSSLVGGQNLNFAIPVEYLSALKLDFKAPVVVAGALSLKDRDNDKLEGVVQSVSEKEAGYRYDERSDKYYEKPAELKDQTKYDLDGNLVEYSSYYKGSLSFRNFWTYDEQGFKTREFVGTPEQHDLTRAESVQQKLETRHFSIISEDPDFGKFVYDRDGNLIEHTSKSDTDVSRDVSTYGRDGLLAETKWYRNDKLQWVSRYKYETDEYGNWIKQYESLYKPKYAELGFTPMSVVYREITYYRR